MDKEVISVTASKMLRCGALDEKRPGVRAGPLDVIMWLGS
jgi:hypothetical protein